LTPLLAQDVGVGLMLATRMNRERRLEYHVNFCPEGGSAYKSSTVLRLTFKATHFCLGVCSEEKSLARNWLPKVSGSIRFDPGTYFWWSTVVW